MGYYFVMEKTKRKNNTITLAHKKKGKSKSGKDSSNNINSEDKYSSSSKENTPKKNISTSYINEINDITEKLANSTIYSRDNEKNKILNFLNSSSNKIILISGQPGTGKTSLVHEIINNSLTKENKYISTITLNCMSLTQSDEFYNEFYKVMNTSDSYDTFKEIFDQKKYNKVINILESEADSKHLLKFLNNFKGYNFCIVLDEIDYLYKKANEIVFYEIINIPYLAETNIKMILISNNSDFDNEILPKLRNRKIQIEKIVFKPYTHIDIFNIMKKKLEDINLLDSFSNDSLRFLSTKMNKFGDLRPIIEIIKNLILSNKDDFSKKTKRIELKDMFSILKQKNINLSEIISSLTTEQKVIAAAVFYAMKAYGTELEEKNIYEKYKMIKKQTNSLELGIEEFREVIKSFCDIGLLEQKYNKKSKSKSKALIIYRVKYLEEDLEILFMDEVMYKLFKNETKEEENNKECEEKEEEKKEK